MPPEINKNIGKRIGANLIDYGLTITIGVIYIMQLGEHNASDHTYSVHGFKSLPLIIFWMTYHVLVEYWTGSTIGHAIFGLVIKNEKGARPDVIQHLKRHLMDPFDFIPFGLPAIISINTTAKHQRIGDRWAKTIVLNKNYKSFKNFYSRSHEEQAWLIENTWCDRCNKADLGLENPVEFKQNSKRYLTGFCNTCGRELISEIKMYGKT